MDSSVLTQRIYRSLLDEIIGGKLRPGEPLSRRRIADRHGCSYTPVIEALIRLEYAGLVETEAFRTPRVCGLSLERIQGDAMLREACETQAIRMACEHATPDEVEELQGFAEEVDALEEVARTRSKAAGAHRDGAEEGPIRDWRFHRRIAELSRCPALLREMERIVLLRRFKATWAFTEGFTGPSHHHTRLVEMIRRRDPLAADAEMRDHVRRGYENEVKGYMAARARATGD